MILGKILYLSDIAVLQKHKGKFAKKQLVIKKFCSFLIVQNLLS